MTSLSYDLDDNQELFFSKLLLRQTGIDYQIQESKDWTNNIKSLIKRKNFKNIDTLIEKLKCGDTELLIELLTIFKPDESGFYQNNDQLKFVSETMLPKFISQGEPFKELSIWCAGCNKGEETYRLAIIVDAYLKSMADWKIKILGTDIFPNDIDTANTGIYPKEAFQNDAAKLIKTKFFKKENDGFIFNNARLKEFIHFNILNLQDDVDSYEQYDLICCRTHFKQMVPAWRTKIFANFSRVLKPWGYLVLNKVDSPLGITNNFRVVPGHAGIYQKAE